MEFEPLEGFGMKLVGTTLPDLAEEEFEQLRRTVEHVGLVVARGQFLTQEIHVQLALRFGPIDEYDTRVPNTSADPLVARRPGTRVVVEATEAALPAPEAVTDSFRWRLDGSFKPEPVCYSTEAAIQIAAGQWATYFINLQHAFDRLSEEDKALSERLQMWHSAVYAKARTGKIDVPIPEDPHELPGAKHPLVRRHPTTGRKGLYIGENAVAVEGERHAVSQATIDHYREAVSEPGNVAVHRWEVGDVLLWDSSYVAHFRQPPVGTGTATFRHISMLSNRSY